MPPIPAGTPTVIPDPGVLTYNQWWIQRFAVEARNSNQPVRLVAVFAKCYLDSAGVPHFSPLPADQNKRFAIPDLFAAMGTNADLATVFDSVVAQLVTLAMKAGVIS